MPEIEELEQKLALLKEEHRDLDEAIERLSHASEMDQLKIQRFKKRKLSLKDEIVRIEGMLIPDIIA